MVYKISKILRDLGKELIFSFGVTENWCKEILATLSFVLFYLSPVLGGADCSRASLAPCANVCQSTLILHVNQSFLELLFSPRLCLVPL